jgi:hypothetical protein
MLPRPSAPRAVALIASVALLAAGCSRDLDTLAPAAFPTEPDVFIDGFVEASFQAFGGSKLDAVTTDPSGARSGTTGLKVTIPGPGDASGGYAGGAIVSNVARDLTGYNALTFWARASITANLDVAGLGNDNTGNSQYPAQWSAIRVTTAWKKYVIPIPLAAKLAQERGLFFFAEGPENGAGYDLWLDDIRFETVSGILNPRPAIAPATVSGEVGATVKVTGTTVTFAVDGVDQLIVAAPGYFTFTSSNPAVATVAENGTIQVLAAGTATVTATLGGTPATGAVSVTAVAPPTVAAPVPTRPAADVVSLFSGAYPNVPVDTWSASWDQADVADQQIAGDAVKKYSNLAFAGIEFTSQPVNASAMTHLHLDVFVQDATQFKVKLVDFGGNGVFGGGDDSEHEVTLSPTSVPPLGKGAWSSLDIPLSSFTGLTGKGHLAQMIIAGSSPTTYLDNVYFYKVPVPTTPPTAAPTPTLPAGNVISLFSNAYPNRVVDTWSAPWDQADLTDLQIAGNDTKKYSNLVFAGIEFTSQPIDATAMTGFHLDLWTPDPTAAPASFRIKLVDFGANGTFGGGDDVEHELAVTAASTPPLATGSWVGIDIPLSAFTGLTTRAHLAQMILVSDPKTVFIDNVYLYSSATPTAPTSPAPTPTYAAGDVISLFSNAYPNRVVDTWSAPWDQADLTDLQIAGNDTKKYSNLVFAGIEFTSQPIDATAMTAFHLDLWTPDPTAAPASFRIKLVDFGANGTFGGGDDVEHELAVTAASTPPLATGSWVGIDIPLSAFTGLTTRAHLAQMILVGDLKTVYVDNVLLRK